MSVEDIYTRRESLTPAKLGLLQQRLERARAQRAQARATAPPTIPRRQDQGPAPLSFAQQRLWFIDQLEPGTNIYNKPSAVRLTGQLNVSALEKTLSEIVRRHEIFRTVFVNTGGHPMQVVNPPQPVALTPIDFSGRNKSDREMLVQHLINEEGARPFDLMRGPVVRVSLFKLAEDDHVAIFTMHHIVSDGWSIGVFVKEIVALYTAFLAGKPSPLPELPVQYADFAVWQREWLQGEVLEEQVGYWKQHLHGVPAMLELPTDRPRSSKMSHRGTRYYMTFPSGLAKSLKELSRREGVTLFMTLLAAWQVLLSRYSRQTDIVVGTTVANRTRSELEGLIGFFVNTLVLRTDVSGDPSFRELLARVKEVALGAYAHQDLPFSKLVEELQPERSMNHTPFFQVTFGVENTPASELSLPGLKLSAVQQKNETAIFDLSLGFFERGDSLHGLLEYSTDLFDAGTIERMARHLTMVLEGVVADVTEPISTLSLLTSAERQQVLVEWNRTTTAYPRELCIQELFEQQCARAPEAVALIFGQEQMSYGELNARANQLAHYLRGLGVGPEVLVGLMVERSFEMIVGLLGILKAGGAYLPLDPQYPMERLAFMIEDAQLPVLLTQERLLDNLPSHWGTVVCLDTEWDVIRNESDNDPGNRVAPDNLAYVIYTSGSTGKPKGVCVSHRGVVRVVKETNYARLDSSEVFLQMAPISFDASTFEIWGALLNEAPLVIFPPERPSLEELAATLRRHQITTLWITTGLFHLMVERQIEALQGLRQLITGGDVMMPAAAEKVLREAVDCRVNNMYGPTEATTFTTYYPMDASQLETNVSIGRPIANTEVYVLDETMKPVGIGIAGELFIGGDGLARGYLRRAELTAERFVPHPFSVAGSARLYRTGDIVRYLEDGRIQFLGRADGQVKVRGYRVELGEIEAALCEHPTLRTAVVIARREADGERKLVGYVVSVDGEAVTGVQLREWLRQRVPDYMVPSVFVNLAELPLTANGKIDRQALPDPSHSRVEELRAYVAPRTAVEEVLCGIWADVLKLEQVGIHDDFFELGGHSLLATQLISHIREGFKVELPLMKLFEQPTVAGFSTCVEVELSKATGLSAPPVLPVLRDEPLPLSFAQQRLWFIDQLQPLSPAYNIPTAMRLTGQLNFDVTQRTFDEVVRRHESLRTTFLSTDGQPVQVVHEPGPVAIPITDLSEVEESEREPRVRELVMAEARRPFDLKAGPLLRVSLLRLGAEEHVALFTMHHIVSDGWSLGILVREVAALYGAYARGEESALPELAVQYGDYAKWQREWLQGEVLERQISYWKEQLKGAPPALELPTDRARPVVMTQRGAQHPFTLSGDLGRGLQELSRREGVTLFMVLLAAFDVLLMRYTGSEDVVVGTPIAGRNRAEVEGLIGFFVNTLVMRTDLSGDPSFRELLERVKDGALGAYAHQDLPFEKLVEELQPQRSLSHTPLFQVMLVLQNAPMGELELPGLKLSPVGGGGAGGPGGETAAKFELTLTLHESREGLRGAVSYNRDLFEVETIERMIRHLTTLLEGVVSDVTQRISRLPLLTSAEQQEVLVEWNRTATAYPRELSIQELFEQQVALEPEAVAVVFGQKQVSYAELNARANQLAHYLRELGVGAETMVGLMVERSVELIVGLLGILKAGGAYVPLDPLYPQTRLSFMLVDADVKILLTQKSLLAGISPDRSVRVVTLDSEYEVLSRQSEQNVENQSVAEHLAYVMYTSGSTGQPKGVCVTHRNVARLVKETNYAAFDSGEVFLQMAPVSFDASTFEIWGSLLNGARLVLMPPHSPSLAEIGRTLRQHGVTTLWLTAGLFHQMVEDQLADLRGVKQLLAGGDVLSVSHVQKVLAGLDDGRLINGYGPTESTTFACCNVMRKETQIGATVPIGQAIGNTELYVLDGYLQPLPVGAVGQLYIGGAGLARGYLGRPELTAGQFIPHPYASEPGARLYDTGDLARFRRGGELEFLGRADGQVKVRGYRVELGEVEAALRGHPTVLEAVVVARTETAGDKRLVGYVVSAGEAVAGGELREWLGQRLPEYMVPSVFVNLAELPLTANGKVDRQGLPDPTRGRSEELRGYVGPRTAVEEVVCGIWGDVLKLEQVGVHDNFFELGGHSLLATQLISRLRDIFRVELPLRTLFQQPTVAGLSLSIESARLADQELAPPVVPVPRDEPLPLSFAQQRLWFIDQLQPLSPAYNVPTAVRLTGRLDLEVTQRTFAEVVRRHESLRTTFLSTDGQPVQVVHEPGPVAIPITDLSEVEESEREPRVRELVMAEARRPFDLKAGPLLRVSLLRLGAEEHVALFTMHHIVSDGWSLGILVREVAALYGAYARGEESALPELAVQYGDYAKWQREWLQGEVLERQISYWKEQLKGAPPALELPTDRARPVVMTQRGAQHPYKLSEELSRGLQELSRREGVTLFMVLLAAFEVLLMRYTGSEDVVVGTPIAGRNRAEVEGLIGFFVNTLVLRTDLSGDPSFRELLERVKDAALGAYAHQDLPFEKLVEELQPQRSLSHTPLFQVMLVLQNAPTGELELPGLKLSPVGGGGVGEPGGEGAPAKFELTLTLFEGREGLRGVVSYSRDLFDAATIERMLAHLTTLLEGVASDATQRISSLPLLNATERRQQLVTWNETRVEYAGPQGLMELFEQQVAREPEAVAVVFGQEQVSYAELNARANQLAHYLRELGVGPESLVAVFLERSVELVVGLLGIVKAGGAYVPLDPLYPAERLSFILGQTAARVVVTRQGMVQDLPHSDAQLVCLDRDWEVINGKSRDNPVSRVESEQLVYVLYTSGSTGQPKGVGVTHRGLVNYLSWARQAYVREGQGAPVHSSIGFDLTVTSLYLPLLTGQSVMMLPEEPGIEALIEALRRRGDFSLVKLTPAHLQLLSEQASPEEVKDWTRTLVIGGDALFGENLSFWRLHAPQARLINEYGPTETVVGCAVYEVSPETISTGAIPIGRAIGNTELYLLDEYLEPLPVGAVGQLYIGGAGLARGYLGRPELTAGQFIPHPYASEPGARLYDTGDLARFRRGGELEFLGRADGQVKVRGYRVELGEVEAALRGHPTVLEAVVVARTETAGDKRLVGYVVSAGEAVAGGELREWLGQRLPEYMVPSVFVNLAELPLTANGKVDRQGLPDPTRGRSEELRGYVGPRTAVEEVVCGIWGDVLKLEQVGVHDNFFELGGHSLLATQLISRLRDIFRVELPLRTLFQQPTVAGLSLSIESARLADQELAPPVVPVPRDEPLPLSFAQQRLWFIDQLQPLSPAYNVPTAVRLTGQLNFDVTQRTFDEVVRRHESLRTTFLSTDGQPVQVVHEPGPVAIPITDLSELEESEREPRVRELVMAEARRPFDLKAGPLLRVSLLRLGAEEHVALFTMHHIVSDGWSLGILVREVAALYGAYARGEESALPELAVQYGDYAKWQREWLQGEVLERQISYWKEQLKGAPPALELPTDRARPRMLSQRGAAHAFTLSGELSRGLQELSRREGVTLFMVLLAAFDVLLMRYTGSEDVVVGTPIAGRNRAEVEGLIGFFVNTLVLRTDLSGDPSFRELLERVKDAALGAYAHQDLPFEKLVEELQPQRSLSHTPLFQVMLVLQNAPTGELELPGLKLSPVGGGGAGEPGGEGAPAKFELTLTLFESREGLRGAVSYNRDLFEAATIERMMAHLTTLLEGVASDATQRISSLLLLSAAERRQQLVIWNDTARTYPQHLGLHQLFEEQASRSPLATALVCGDLRLSYAELDQRANRLANQLRSLGAGPESLVGLLCDRSAELIVGVLGILKSGAAYVPGDPTYPPQRLRQIFDDAQCRLLLTQQKLLEARPEMATAAAQVICLDAVTSGEVDGEAVSEAAEQRPANPENLAYVLYTSGSTGRPKGVAITHRSAVSMVQWALETYSAQQLAGVLASTSICFDLSVYEVFATLAAGGKVIMVEDALQLPTLAAAGEVTLVNTVPSAMAELLRMNGVPASVQVVNLAGEVLPGTLVRDIYEQTGAQQVWNLYGPTEDTTYSTYALVAAASEEKPPIGKPISNTQVYLLDERMEPVVLGAVGELYLGGAGLARGYLGRPELTAERFVPDGFAVEGGRRLYRTGDLARYRAGGELEYLGRVDYQVKLRGFRIELGEVEAALREHPTVNECVAVVREVAGDKRLVGYVVSAEGEAVAGAQLREWLRQRLPDYMVPSMFVNLEQLPLTPNGKVDRKALPDPEPGGGPLSTFVAPRDLTEVQLAKIWEEVLGVETVGAHDNFFDLGGHSMIATRMMHRIEQAFGRKLPLAALFESPTVEHLAALLREQTETLFSSLVQIQAGKGGPPLFCVHPSGGNILCYSELARHLGSDQPIYGLQAQALDKERTAHTTVEAMAIHYVELLRTVQPEGPYFLAAWSMGGVVAFEMAQQLNAQGQKVAKLALIDVMAPTPAGTLRSLSQPLHKAWSRLDKDEALRITIQFAQDIGLNLMNMPAWREKLEPLKPDGQLAWVVEEAKQYKILPSDMSDEEVAHLFDVFRTNVHARQNYAGRTYHGRVKLFIAEERFLKSIENPTTGWAKLIPEGLDYEAVPGDHYTMIRKPNARVLAERLRMFLGVALTDA